MKSVVAIATLALGSAYTPPNGDANSCTEWKLITSFETNANKYDGNAANNPAPFDPAAMESEKAPTGIYRISNVAGTHNLYIYDEKGWQPSTSDTVENPHTWNTKATGESDYPMYVWKVIASYGPTLTMSLFLSCALRLEPGAPWTAATGRSCGRFQA